MENASLGRSWASSTKQRQNKAYPSAFDKRQNLHLLPAGNMWNRIRAAREGDYTGAGMKAGQMLQHEREITFVPGQGRELIYGQWVVVMVVAGHRWERLKVTCRESSWWLKDQPRLLHLRLQQTELEKTSSKRSQCNYCTGDAGVAESLFCLLLCKSCVELPNLNPLI